MHSVVPPVRPVILSFIEIPPPFYERISVAGFELRYALDPAVRRAAIAESGGEVRGLITSGLQGAHADEMEAMSKLEIICALGAGYENVDIAEARRRGLVVTHGPGTNSRSVADHAMALLLAIVRDIPAADAAVRRGAWAGLRASRPSPSRKKLGIFGLGRIGSEIARRGALGFDMEVAYCNRRPVPDSAYGYFSDVRSLAAWSDFLVVASPGGRETHHAVDAPVLEALGPSGYVVNVARGTVVDTDALAHALRNGIIAGAALDVIEGEPNVPPAILELPNLVLTPHIASRSPEAVEAAWSLLLDNLRAHFTGQDVLTPVPG